MLNRFSKLSSTSLALLVSGFLGFVAAPVHAADPQVSDANRWQFTEDPEYSYNKGSASKLISIKEAVLHHTLGIKINRSMIDSFTFKVGCMLQNPTPLMELRVNSLDIRLFDSVNDFVFARFVVDKGQEYSLRGDLAGRNRILFAPLTENQERSLSDLFLQMREGGTLKIALLQGATAKVRVYEVPLAGFMEHSDALVQSCQNYNRAWRGERTYLPDYMGREPEGYAPKDYNLKEDEEEVIDPNAPKPVVVEETVKEEKPEKAPPPEVMPFAPGGGPASIGPDGRPVGASGGVNTGTAGAAVDKSLGNATGPMQIGPDGRPVQQPAQQPAQQGAAPAPAPAPAPEQAPAQQPGQQPGQQSPQPAGNNAAGDPGAMDIF